MLFILLLAIISAVPTKSCLTPCTDGVCSRGSRASLISDGECVFDATVHRRNVFITGHIFSHGTCAAVQQQVSKKCYDNMTSAIAEGTQGMHVAKDTLRCSTHIHNSPCTLEEHKWYIKSSIKVGTCADLKLMYEDVMEACLREKPDARFWLSALYISGFSMVFLTIKLIAMFYS